MAIERVVKTSFSGRVFFLVFIAVILVFEAGVVTYSQDVQLFLTKNRPGSDTDAVLNWTQGPFTGQTYEVRRSTDAETLVSGLPWRSLTELTTTDTEIGSAPLLFYDVKVVSPNLTLSWEGVNPDLLDDGFYPTPVEDYNDGIEDLTISGDACEFWVKLTSSIGLFPTTIDLLLDRNGDGDYEDSGEVIPLSEFDPLDTDTTDGKLYFVALPSSMDAPEELGTPPTSNSPLYVRNHLGYTRWDFANTTGETKYKFRATDDSGVAGGDPTFDKTLIALNTAQELIDDLGKPVVSSGNCSKTTDWHTALVYFEEAEERVKPSSPYNLASEPERNIYYLNSLLASTIAETGYILQNYQTLFETPGSKRYRDTMLDWKNFTDKQIARMEHLSNWALSEPNTAWEFQFPKFCIWLEETGTTPFVNTTGLATDALFKPLFGFVNPAMPPSQFINLSYAATPKAKSSRIEADEPVYTFEQSYWDRTDAYALSALFHLWRASVITGRIYEDVNASNPIIVGNLGDIKTWLEPEEDAENRAKCDTEPCPELNGIDDDGDGLIDDLGYSARVFETFDGVGIYSPDYANNCTLEFATDDISKATFCFRKALINLLKESDIQSDDATLVYGDGGTHPPSFIDVKSYNGLQVNGDPCPPSGDCPDGLPDLQYISGDFLPVPWCPPQQAGDPEPPLYNTPISIKGGLSGDIDWWIKEIVNAYNDISGENFDKACYPEAWVFTLYSADWGYTLERAVADTTPHYTINLRDDIENYLADNDINPSDLGGDFEKILNFAEDIDVRMFIENPENVRNYVPYYCQTHTEPICDEAINYTFNGFFGDWDEPCDPIVPDKFWTIEPFTVFNQDENGILDVSCDPANINTDSDCLKINWNDIDGDGKFDLFEPILMANNSSPLQYIDLNGDGQWNGWSDRDHKKVLYSGEPIDPGKGLYNALYIYFKDPTFGGRLSGMTNEGFNNYVSAVAGLVDGILSYPSNNHHPTNYSIVEEIPTLPGANLRLKISATDPDEDTLHYYLVLPSIWAGSGVIKSGMDDGIWELNAPSGQWGFVGLAYDNVNNLNDIVADYIVITR
jgi:hypothetical protein